MLSSPPMSYLIGSQSHHSFRSTFTVFIASLIGRIRLSGAEFHPPIKLVEHLVASSTLVSHTIASGVPIPGGGGVDAFLLGRQRR